MDERDVTREAAGMAVGAADFGLRGPRGWAFRGVGFDAEPGSLVAIEGPSGSGRSGLLLALTGRMKAGEGRATVGPHRLPRHMPAVRRISALAHVPGVTDLEPSLTVGEHLRERALLQRRFGGSVRGALGELVRPRADRAADARLHVDEAKAAAGLDLEALPKGARTAVRDLERLEVLRLSIALALIGRPRLLGVDDTDLKLTDAERDEVWALLETIAGSGTTVLAVCSQAPEGAVVVSTRRTDSAVTTRGPDTAVATAQGRQRSHNTAVTAAKNGRNDDKETADALAETGRA